jgi:hypothetical protein
MSKLKYIKPRAQLLNRALAIALGKCAVGNSAVPGGGTCSPTGATYKTGTCNAGSVASSNCNDGSHAGA